MPSSRAPQTKDVQFSEKKRWTMPNSNLTVIKNSISCRRFHNPHYSTESQRLPQGLDKCKVILIAALRQSLTRRRVSTIFTEAHRYQPSMTAYQEVSRFNKKSFKMKSWCFLQQYRNQWLSSKELIAVQMKRRQWISYIGPYVYSQKSRVNILLTCFIKI